MIQAKAASLSPVESREIATRLHHDPFLVGLFTLMADEGMSAQRLGAVADDAIGQFLDSQIRELHSAVGLDLLPDELLEGMTYVAQEMILRRTLRPSWEELAIWLGDGSKPLRGIRPLVRQGQVCRLDAKGKLDFRHDRLQEWFLVKAMGELLQTGEPPLDIITDPYYSGIVGKALAGTILPAEQLVRLRRSAPLTIFEAVRYVAEPSNEHQNRLFLEAHTWAEKDSRSAPDSVLGAISWTLLHTDSDRVLPIIDAMEPNRLLMAAGLRNGSTRHGMRFFRGRVHNSFEPGSGDALRDQVVEHAGHRHRDKLALQLREELPRCDLSALDSKAYLALLGHFRFAEFDQLILDVWQRYQDEVLAYGIWAAARCPLHDVGGMLGPMVAQLEALPVRTDYTQRLSDREWITLYLSWGFRRGITAGALAHLLDAGRRNQGLRRDVSLMIEGVDHPDAVEFLVRRMAEGGGSRLWSILTGIGDGEPQTRFGSPETVDRLRNLWDSVNESEGVRTQGFCLWLRMTGCRDTTLLATIEPGSSFYMYAVQHRVRLGDSSVVPDLVRLLQSVEMQGAWWLLAHRVWCEELRSIASETLAGFCDEIPIDFSGGPHDQLLLLAELLVKIPVSDGEQLLQHHWGYLRYSPWMIHAALRIGTPTCVELAREALALCPADVDVFELAFSTIWEVSNPANPVTLRHLECLEPYLDRMTQDEVLFLAWETERAVGADEGVADWIRTHAVPRLPPEDQARVQVADQMLIRHLNREYEETRFQPCIGYLFEERGGHRFVFPERQLRLLDDWLSDHRTARGLHVAAECLKHIGTRESLSLLDRYPIDGDVGEVDRIKADARFSMYRRTLG